MKPWPTCPVCMARRVAVCKFCRTEGDNFPLADLDYLIPGRDVNSLRRMIRSGHAPFEEETHDGSCACSHDEDDVVVQPSLAETLGPAYSIEVRMQKEAPNGHTACGKQQSSLRLTQPLDADPEDLTPADTEHPLAVLCPCCGELLYPRFYDVCAVCGHAFPDGISTRDQDAEPEENHLVMLVVFFGMLALLGALVLALI